VAVRPSHKGRSPPGGADGRARWPLQNSLADILDVGPSPADPPEEDWALLDELAAAVAALSEKLRAEPELSRDEAMLFVKTETNAPGVWFRSIVWPALEIPLGSPSRINSVLCLR